MSANPTVAVLPRRAFYYLVVAALVGIGTGIMTYTTTPVPAGAIAAGIVAFFGTAGWLQAVDWHALNNWHGLGLVTISVGFGAGMGLLAHWGGAPLAGCLLTGVPLASAAVLVLPRIVP